MVKEMKNEENCWKKRNTSPLFIERREHISSIYWKKRTHLLYLLKEENTSLLI